MSFTRAQINASPKMAALAATGIRAGIRGSKLPRLFINLTNEVAKKLSLRDGDLLEVLLGEGEHHGLIRFRVDPDNGTARVDEVASAGEGFFQILLGNQPLYANTQCHRKIASGKNWTTATSKSFFPSGRMKPDKRREQPKRKLRLRFRKILFTIRPQTHD